MMDERSLGSIFSGYSVGSSSGRIPESLTNIALCRPFEIRWSLPEKRGIDRSLLGCLRYSSIEDPTSHEVFTVLRHIQGNHGGQLNFLQPGFLIASLDDRPLHTVGAKRTSFQSMVIPSLSNVEQDCSRGAVGGFDPRFSEEQSNGNKADIIFMKPVGRLMNNAECASSNHRGQPSLVSSSSFGDTEHSSSIVDRDPLVDLWNSASSEVMHHIPFCYLTLLSAMPLDQNPSQLLLDDLFLRRELGAATESALSFLSTGSPISSNSGGNKFFLNVTMDVHGQINWKTLNETPDLYLRCKATVYARLLRRNTSPMPLEEILLRTPAPAHVLSPLLEGNVDRSVDVFVSGASNKSHKFLQLFTALYSIMLITFDADDLNDAQISRIYEYMAKVQYFVSNSASVPIYLVGVTKRLGTGCEESGPYPSLIKGCCNGGGGGSSGTNSAFDPGAFPSEMSEVVMKLNKVLANLGGSLNVNLCILSDVSEASRRIGINNLRSAILEDIVLQKSWGFARECSGGKTRQHSDRYLVKFLACRQIVISKSQYQWSNNQSACMEIEDFVKFILDHSKLIPRELTAAISYFENSGFIKTITATTNTSKGWVLLYPQYVFVVICNLMKQFLAVEQNQQLLNTGSAEFKQMGLLHSRLWALHFDNPLSVVLRPFSIMTYLGLFYFDLSQRGQQRRVLMASQFDPNSRRRRNTFSELEEDNNSRVEIIDKRKKKCKYVASGSKGNTGADSELLFAISLSGSVSRKTAWELHQILFCLIVECSYLFSISKNSFFALFPAELVSENFLPFPEDKVSELGNHKCLQIQFHFMGIKPLKNAILVKARVMMASKDESSAICMSNCERIFGSFLRERARRVLQQLQGNDPGANVAACIEMSSGIQVEPLCSLDENSFET